MKDFVAFIIGTSLAFGVVTGMFIAVYELYTYFSAK
jgi:uncharacterized protein YneF (UPF0154 family)